MKERAEKIIDASLEFFWLIIIFLIPVYFNWHQSYTVFSLGKIVLFRILTEILLIVFSVKILFFKIKINFSFKKIVPFLFFFFFISLATFLSPYIYNSFWGSFFRHLGFFSFLHYFALFLVLLFSLKNNRQIKRIVTAALFSSFIVCLYGFLQIFDLDPFPWTEKFSQTWRVISTVGQPNFLGAFLVLVFPFVIIALFYFQASERNAKTKFLHFRASAENTTERFYFQASEENTVLLNTQSLAAGYDKIFGRDLIPRSRSGLYKICWQKIFLLILGFLEIFILIFTLSRSAWLGFLSSLFLLLIIYLYFKKKRGLLFSFFLLLIFGLFFYIYLTPALANSNNPVFYRLSSLIDFNSPTAKMRLLYWRAVPEIVKKRPILGYGLESQFFIFPEYYAPEYAVYEEINSHPDRAHNEILDTLITTGFLGLISYLFLIVFIFYQGSKEKSFFSLFLLSGLFGYLTVNQFSFPSVETMLYFWLCLALVMFMANKNSEEKEYQCNFKLISKLSILIVFVFTVLILARYKNINLLKADYYFYQARKDNNQKNLLKMLDDYELVFTNNFYESYYRWQETQDVLNLTNKFNNQELKKDILEIVYKNLNDIPPQNQTFEFLALKAQLLSTYGTVQEKRFEEAEKVYFQLSKSSPQMAGVYNDWGRMYLLKKDYQKAIEKFNKALILYPPLNHPDINCCNRKGQIQKEMSMVYYNLGKAYLYQKHYNKAVKYYQFSLRLNPFDASIFGDLSDIYYLQKNISQAIKENLNGLKLEPKNKKWYENLILLYKEKGDLKKTKEYEAKILELEKKITLLNKF